MNEFCRVFKEAGEELAVWAELRTVTALDLIVLLLLFAENPGHSSRVGKLSITFQAREAVPM